MSGPYPPYSGDDGSCTKCGGEMDKTYHPSGTVHLGGDRVARTGPSSNFPEWLLRECFDCGYAWPEMCADAVSE